MMFVEVEAGSSERTVSRWGFALPLVPITLSVFCLSALVYYQVQRGGTEPPQGLLQGLVVGLHGLIGFVPSFLFCLLVLAWSSIWFFNGTLERPGARLGRLGALALSLAILVNLGEGATAVVPPGGAIGEFLAVRFESVLGTGLCTLLASVAAIASLLLATDYFFYRYFEPLGRPGRGADLRDELGTEAEATEVLSTLPVPELRALAARRRGAAAVEPVEIVTGDEETAVAAPERDAEEEAGGGASWRARRRVQRHLRIDDEVEIEPDANAERGGESDADAEEASGDEDFEVWDEDETPAAVANLDDQDWEDDDDESDDDDDEAEEEDDVDWEEADYEDEDEDDEDDEDDDYDDDEDDEDDEDEEDDDDDDEDEEDDDDDFPGFEDEEDDERAEIGEPAPVAAALDEPELDTALDDAAAAAAARGETEGEPYEIPRPEPVPAPAGDGRRRQGSLFAGASAEVGLIDEAARTVIRAHRASVTLLQRRMRVDYQEACGLMEDLRQQGVVGGEAGETHAPVLMDMAAWDAR